MSLNVAILTGSMTFEVPISRSDFTMGSKLHHLMSDFIIQVKS